MLMVAVRRIQLSGRAFEEWSCRCTSSGENRGLHSFPTRRSSDLRAHGPLGHEGGPTLDDHPGEPRPVLVVAVYDEDWSRSEEHTSELQSRLHLVCRLQLDKKIGVPTVLRLDMIHGSQAVKKAVNN